MPFTVVRSPENWEAQTGSSRHCVLSVGNFDGLHLGHQKILSSVVARARAASLPAAVITFDPHPLRLLRPAQAPRMIETLEQRLAGFERMGLDAALVLAFNRELSLLPAEEFIEQILVARLHVAAVLIGANFKFGHRGAGNVALLERLGVRHGFQVEIVPPVEVDGQVISSTAIRAAVEAGRVADAAPLLGRSFSLTGEIRRGEGRGRSILFPTLNLAAEQELLPKIGVYVTECVLGARTYNSVTNVGRRPTFNGQDISVESHLFGFHDELTSGRMAVNFQMHLRDEQKFPGPEQLRAQIASDIAAAQEYLGSLPGKRR